METSSKEQNPSPSVRQQPSKRRQKRKLKDFGSSNNLYEDVSFSKRTSTGRPGTPHRYFTSSYDVHVTETTNSKSNQTHDSKNDEDVSVDYDKFPSKQRVNNENNDTTNVKETPKVSPTYNVTDFVVHCHVNGLCMITIGDAIKNQLGMRGSEQTIQEDDQLADSSDQKIILHDSNKAKMVQNQSISSDFCPTSSNLTISKVDFMIKTSTSQTVGQKRKQAKKMKKGARQSNHQNSSGMVQPGDIIATIHVSDGSVIHVKSCVNGSILELNENLKSDPNLLLQDPLLDGYVAVILPNGPFPPNKRIGSNVNK